MMMMMMMMMMMICLYIKTLNKKCSKEKMLVDTNKALLYSKHVQK
jgi:hypothetical protein